MGLLRDSWWRLEVFLCLISFLQEASCWNLLASWRETEFFFSFRGVTCRCEGANRLISGVSDLTAYRWIWVYNALLVLLNDLQWKKSKLHLDDLQDDLASKLGASHTTASRNDSVIPLRHVAATLGVSWFLLEPAKFPQPHQGTWKCRRMPAYSGCQWPYRLNYTKSLPFSFFFFFCFSDRS